MAVNKKLKVLFVCPFAHYTGHFSWAAVHETQALAGANVDIRLLTFCGVTDKSRVTVPQSIVREHTTVGTPFYHLANYLRRWKGIGFISMFIEAFMTQSVAIRLRKKDGYDIIHLRDGEPFLFLPHLFGTFNKNGRWLVSLTGSVFITRPPSSAEIRKNLRLFLYGLYIKAINSHFWKPFYRQSLARNHFLFITQNPKMKQIAEQYMDGVLAGKVLSLELGVDGVEKVISKKEARRYFGLPQDRPVFLSFGFLHAGKDVETIFKAMKDIPPAYLLHGGDQMFRLNLPDSVSLVDKYKMTDRAIIKDKYIPEEEKPYYFFASDAVVLSYTKQFLSTTSLLWQACRFGIPVIASDNGQLGKMVDTHGVGLVFKAEDAGSLRKAMVSFINLGPGELRELKSNCHRFAREFSLASWAEKCLQLYHKLLAGKIP